MRTPVWIVQPATTNSGDTDANTQTTPNIGSGRQADDSILLFVVPTGGRLLEFGIVIQTAVTVSAATLTLKVRPTISLTTSERTVDTLTVPVTNSTIGDVVRNASIGSLANAAVNPGEQVEIEITTAGGGAGAGIPYVVVEPFGIAAGGEADTAGKAKPFLTNAVGKIKSLVS